MNMKFGMISMNVFVTLNGEHEALPDLILQFEIWGTFITLSIKLTDKIKCTPFKKTKPNRH